jgi:hypothetical protein
MKKNFFLSVLILTFVNSKMLFSQESPTQNKKNNPSSEIIKIGSVNRLYNPLELDRGIHSLNALIDYKKDTLYTLMLCPLSEGGIAIPPAAITFYSNILSLGRIKNYIKDVYNSEPNKITEPIKIDEFKSLMAMKFKKDINILIINTTSLPLNVTFSKKDLNKLFGDDFLK